MPNSISGEAFWICKETFKGIPDSCSIKVRTRWKDNTTPPDKISGIIPMPQITAIVIYANDSKHSYIEKGIDRTITSVSKGNVEYDNICLKEYSSVCFFTPSVSIINRTY